MPSKRAMYTCVHPSLCYLKLTSPERERRGQLSKAQHRHQEQPLRLLPAWAPICGPPLTAANPAGTPSTFKMCTSLQHLILVKKL